jgi:hypothetical protein
VRAPLLTGIASGIGALYLTIWPHELAHSSVAHLWGCKAHWWQTGMSYTLWNSVPGRIDWACLAKTSGVGLTAIAGIVLNLVFLGLAAALVRTRAVAGRPWLFVAVVFWALANYAEAFSYLVLNTAWLKSDMEAVVEVWGPGRWAWFAVGLAGAVVCARGLRRTLRAAAALLASRRMSPRAWLWLFAAYVAIAGAVMAAARIVLM